MSVMIISFFKGNKACFGDLHATASFVPARLIPAVSCGGDDSVPSAAVAAATASSFRDGGTGDLMLTGSGTLPRYAAIELPLRLALPEIVAGALPNV